jgi:hypothetical protein
MKSSRTTIKRRGTSRDEEPDHEIQSDDDQAARDEPR